MPYYAAPLLPLIIDPIFVSWLGDDDGKAAVNMAAVGLEAFSYAGLLSFVSTRLSVRQRPDSRECQLHPVAERDCPSDTESFYSGHTTIAAASAGARTRIRVTKEWSALSTVTGPVTGPA